MNILQIIFARNFGGAERYFIRLTEHLRSCGHNVQIVVLENSPLHCELMKRNIPAHAWRNPSRHNLALRWKLHQLIRREKIEVINTHLNKAGILGNAIGKSMKIPVVVRVAATGDPFPNDAPHFIAVANGVKDYITSKGVLPERVKVIYNGVNLTQYTNADRQKPTKRELGFQDDQILLAVIANLRERKGHLYLFESLKQLQPHKVQVLCVGEGEDDYINSLRETVKLLDVEDQVHFLGRRNDIPSILSACDIFVLPSLQEGLSNAVMEAMAIGCPVISTNVGGLAEIVIHEQTGLLVPPADSDALAKALLRLIENEHFRYRIAEQARMNIEKNFDQAYWLRAAEQYLQQIARVSQ